MTANQIAFAQAQTQKQVAEWNKEHNEEFREETKRHNIEMERLQENAVNAQEHGNRIQENWNKWQEQWQTEYQAKWREYELAQEDRKIDIQNELVRLEDRKVTAEESYKAAQEANLVYMQGIAADQLALDTSFKEWTKEYQNKQYELNEFQAKVREKEVEYNAAMQHEQNVIASNRNIQQQDYNYALLNFEREKMNRSLANQYNIANLTYDISKQNLLIQQENLDLYRRKVSAENFASYSSGLFGRAGIIPGTVQTATSIIPIIGGIDNGKITRKVAEAILFK